MSTKSPNTTKLFVVKETAQIVEGSSPIGEALLLFDKDNMLTQYISVKFKKHKYALTVKEMGKLIPIIAANKKIATALKRKGTTTAVKILRKSKQLTINLVSNSIDIDQSTMLLITDYIIAELNSFLNSIQKDIHHGIK